MYEQYWSLSRNPFQDLRDPAFFYRGSVFESALLKMQYLVEHRKGAGVLFGDSGCGKSFLAAMLQHELPDEFGPIVHLVFPQLTPAELMAYLAVELGADDAALDRREIRLDRVVRQLQRELTRLTEQGRHPVFLIDDAHLIDDQRVFQTLQLLLNFQQPPHIEFSLILIADTSFAGQVNRMGQFNERLAVKCLLPPLSAPETKKYTEHRLQAAGGQANTFEPSALQMLYERSGGIPRRINRICDLALLVGYADELKSLSAEHIASVSEELMSVAAA